MAEAVASRCSRGRLVPCPEHGRDGCPEPSTPVAKRRLNYAHAPQVNGYCNCGRLWPHEATGAIADPHKACRCDPDCCTGEIRPEDMTDPSKWCRYCGLRLAREDPCPADRSAS